MFSIIFRLFCLKFAHCEAFLKNKQHRRIIVVLLTATLAAGCGGSDDDESDGDATEDGVTSTSLLLNDDQILIELRALVEENNLEPLPAAPTVSVELYELGQKLAFDKILSGNKDISCLTCHHPEIGTDDDRHLPLGEGGDGLGADRDGGSVIARNSQPLFNLDLFENMFWDGRVEFVEGEYLTPAGDQLTAAMTAVFDFGVVSAQAMFPVTDASEMRGQPGTNELADLDADDFTGIWSGLMTRLGAIPEYETLFKAAYPGVDFDDMTFAHAANAIAGFEIAAFDHRDNPWQRFIAGDDDAMDADARRGAHLFYSINCQGCHSGAVGSDFGFHNLVLAQFGPGKGHGTDDIEDFGREAITGDEEQRYEFRTPPLFNVDLTGPYGHLGQFTEIRHHMRTYGSPRFWRNTYTIERQVADESLWATLVDNATEVHDARETVELVADVFSDDGQLPQHLSFLESFMSAQTDEQALDMSHLVPASVPSGLAVED